MIDRSEIKQALVIADRGYESYNNISHIQEKGWKFLIRVKEGKDGMCGKLELPTTDCFDFSVKLSLTRKWNIETSFRNLKYVIGLAKFHAKKVMCLEQEIFARLIMYNFVEMITSHVVIKVKPKQYAYKANFSVAVQVCRDFFRGKTTSPYVETMIANNTIPVRTGRSSLGKTTNRTFAGFQYRIA